MDMEEYLTTEEFAQIARTSPATVRYWEYLGKGPVSIKRGRRRLYPKSGVILWLATGDQQIGAA